MAHKSVVLTVYIFALVTGLPSNLVACYSFMRKVRQKPVPIDILLLNLTISDLFLLFFLPFKMVEAALDNTWLLPYFLCLLANLSTLFLMGVSVERYLCVAHPVKHKLNHRPTYAKVASLFFWLLACSHCLSIVYVRGPEKMAPKGLVLAVYIFAFVTGLPSNLLACYSFLRKVRQNPVPIDILLLNLTISDLFLLFFLPFKMVEAALDNTWPLPYFLCPLANLFFYGSAYLSSLFLMGVSVERYLCVAHPVKHKLNHRPTYAKVASIFFWFLTFSHCLSIVYVVEYYEGTDKKTDDNSTCYENFTAEQLRIVLPFRLEFCIVLFFIPFIITLFCYISVIRILTYMPNIKPQKKQRAVALALATVLNFSLAFAPYNISHIVGFIQNKNPSWRVETFFLISVNTTLDPVIFFFSSGTIRQVFTEYWLGICSYLQAFVSWCLFPCCSVLNDNDEEDDRRFTSNPGIQTVMVVLSSVLTAQQRPGTSEQ